MKKVIFICHGNICRSPLAEFIFKDMVNKKGYADKFEITSRATSNEALGGSLYPPLKVILTANHIPFTEREAKQITLDEVRSADYIIGMEEFNLVNLSRMFFIRDKSKIHLLNDFSPAPSNIDDPYYSRDFQKAFKDVYQGCQYFLTYLETNNLI